MENIIKEELWSESLRLGCEHLRYNKYFDMWICKEKDPCISKICNNEKCRNYGKPFDRQNKLLIIKIKGKEKYV